MKVIYYKIGDKMSKIDEKLLIYQKFINLIYYSKNLLNKYPKSERFDLCSDIKNALYKELKNIIYAWKAYSNQEKLKYLYISFYIKVQHRTRQLHDPSNCY